MQVVYSASAGSIGEESEKRDGEGEGANEGRALSHGGSALDPQRSLGNRGGSQGLGMVSLKWGGPWGVYTLTLGGGGLLLGARCPALWLLRWGSSNALAVNSGREHTGLSCVASVFGQRVIPLPLGGLKLAILAQYVVDALIEKTRGNQQPGCGGKGTLTCWWACKRVQQLWKTLAVPQHLKIEGTCDPAIPVLGVHPKEMKSHLRRDTGVPVCMATLLPTART